MQKYPICIQVFLLPEPHRYAVCADEYIPIKEFYKGVFEEIFVFYHPFIRPKVIGVCQKVVSNKKDKDKSAVL
ncbi:hypothetical protein AF332_26085 [Sporosarcina globispora]|uniref:Uncharacterized protein n=1 Tax=Sporosarcina globispora TaxID=1459 RepID=A0A0M0GKF9_SPOGL|nr:hypothetical protein [Sporosarcina globispora]KON89952.1 hypothetical protein AF332_26085 [Sporosarcina globispora]